MVKKKYWVGRIREGNTVEIKVKDGSEALLDWWEFNINDKKTAKKVMNIIRLKYGFDISDKIMEQKDTDMDWLLGNE